MKIRIIFHARWEIPFEFFSPRNYFEDELDDELDVKNEDEEGDLFLFSCLDLDLFLLFFVGAFYLWT